MPTKEETRVVLETMRKAMPRDVGGILSRTVGTTEAAERTKRTRLRHDRRRFGKEHELRRLEAAIFEPDVFGKVSLKENV